MHELEFEVAYLKSKKANVGAQAVGKALDAGCPVCFAIAKEKCFDLLGKSCPPHAERGRQARWQEMQL